MTDEKTYYHLAIAKRRDCHTALDAGDRYNEILTMWEDGDVMTGDETAWLLARVADLVAERDEWIANCGELANMPGEREAWSERNAAIKRAEAAEAEAAKWKHKLEVFHPTLKATAEDRDAMRAERNAAIQRAEAAEARAEKLHAEHEELCDAVRRALGDKLERRPLAEQIAELGIRAEAAFGCVDKLETLIRKVRDEVGNTGMSLDGLIPEDVCERVLEMTHGFDRYEDGAESPYSVGFSAGVESAKWLGGAPPEDHVAVILPREDAEEWYAAFEGWKVNAEVCERSYDALKAALRKALGGDDG